MLRLALRIKNYSGKEEEILDYLIEHHWIKRIKAGIPIIVAVVGKSAHGKSAFVVSLQEKILKIFGLNPVEVIPRTVLISPQDYAKKGRDFFYNPELKKACCLQIDEAKYLLNSDNWQSRRNQAIRKIIATCRTLKPTILFILAQRRKDIDPKTRDTLDYFIKVERYPNERPHIDIKEVYETESNFEKPEIKTKPMLVHLENKLGESQTLIPVFNPAMPSEEVWAAYKAIEEPAKSEEILKIFDELEKIAEAEAGGQSAKIKEFVEFLKSNPLELAKMGKFTRGKWRLDSKMIKRIGYGSAQVREIEKSLRESLSVFKGEIEGELENGNVQQQV